MKTLSGKVAIVTGSSRGIGKAIALKLASEGASIVLNGRDQQRLDSAKKLVEKVNANVIAVRCDVSLETEAKELIEASIKEFGKLDILINNVGVSNRGTVADCKPEVFKKVFESNVFGTVNPTIFALPHIKKNKGSIVFISSLAGVRGLPSLGAYSSSKMALRAIAESIRIEEADAGIHVGLIYVGFTEVEHNKEAIGADGSPVVLKDRSSKNAQTVEYVAEKVVKNIKRRKFITTLSALGKLNTFLQPRFPLLIEKLLIRANKIIAERSK